MLQWYADYMDNLERDGSVNHGDGKWITFYPLLTTVWVSSLI